MLYLRELETHDLSRYAAVVVPDGMDSAGIRRYAAQLNAYVRGGGFLVVFGCKGVHEWIDVVEARLAAGRHQGLAVVDQAQALSRNPSAGTAAIRSARSFPLADMSWHWFGVFEPASGRRRARSISTTTAAACCSISASSRAAGD